MNLVEKYVDKKIRKRKWKKLCNAYSKMGKEITINNNNYEAYKKLYEISDKNGDYCYYDDKSAIISLIQRIILNVITLTIVVAGFVFLNPLSMGEFVLLNIIPISCCVAACVFLPDALSLKRNARLFKRDYPSIDQDIDMNKLEKELIKYKELSKIPKDIENKKEEHLITLENDFNKKTTTEKIEMLKEELEFWNQVKTKEKYDNEQERLKQKVYDL